MGGGEFEPSGDCNPPPCYRSSPPAYCASPPGCRAPPPSYCTPPPSCRAQPQPHCTSPPTHCTPPPGCRAMPPGCRAMPPGYRAPPPPRLNPNLFNPPPLNTDDEWDGITDEEASFAYDCAMAELRFSCLRVGGSQSNYIVGSPRKVTSI
ncbi:putative small proline-rich protein 5 [Helianthus annuus]|uniref:putative small proline-rich protein 5 n=1 Tax=Helianthus annuus TaxID=4232 RepID=UPI000B8F0BEE|nr:putative small proline-rich protein 5 [Helianthus annuus]